MKKLLTITLALLTFILMSCGKSKVDANGCYANFDDALEVAQKKNKDIMLIISMDEDDEDSKDFMDKIVRNENFKKEIAEQYAVVNMDFSQKTFEAAANDKDKSELLEKNRKLVTLLQVSDVPVVYIISKEQYLIKGFFYDDENRSYEGFKNELADKAALIEQMHKMIYQTKIGTAEEKISAIEDLYQATNPTYRIFLIDLMDSVKKLDPSNSSGLVGKYIYETAAEKSNKAYLEGDIRAAVDAYLKIADEELVQNETKQIALYTAAYMSSKTELDSIPVVIEYLNKAIAFAPESEQVPAIKRVIAALEAQAAAEAKAE